MKKKSKRRHWRKRRQRRQRKRSMWKIMCKSDTKWHAKWRHQVRLSPQSAMKMVQYLLLATPPLLTTLPYRTTPRRILFCRFFRLKWILHVIFDSSKIDLNLLAFLIPSLHVYHQTVWIRVNVSTLVIFVLKSQNYSDLFSFWSYMCIIRQTGFDAIFPHW